MRAPFILLFSFVYSFALCQSVDFGTTSNTSKNPTNIRKEPVKKKHLLALIKNNPKNTLTGNKCMDEVTRSMGFEYVLQPKGSAGNRSELGRNVHNLGVKAVLFFKNGPFWKFKLKKKRRECKDKTADYVGMLR